MPELPEVETTRRGIEPHILGRPVCGVVIRQHRLRWPIPEDLPQLLSGQVIYSVTRRAKYLLLGCERGTLILHLGMSGSLRVLPTDSQATAHDHIDLQFGEHCLRLRDPRRFGAVLWTEQDVSEHPLLRHLGPEPLSDAFNATYLHQQAKRRRGAVKNLIMDGRVVVGVGNIYASESLFRAGIHPTRPANRIALARYQRLVESIQQVLTAAIKQGGTTLRDFQQEDGKPGYFAQELLVYGKSGDPCPQCGESIQQKVIGQRNSFYCRHCQR